jgi:hypothetical protein
MLLIRSSLCYDLQVDFAARGARILPGEIKNSFRKEPSIKFIKIPLKGRNCCGSVSIYG